MASTLAIVATVSAVAVPAFGNLYMNLRVKHAASEFAADLRYARAEAVARHTPIQVVAPDERGWTGGWLVRDTARVLLDRTGLSRVLVVASDQARLTYTRMGSLSRTGSYSVLFHAPDFRWVQPRCVYVGPDGRPVVENHAPNSRCGAS